MTSLASILRACRIGGALALLLVWSVAARAGLVEIVRSQKPAVVAVGIFNPTATPRFNFRGSGFAVVDGQHVVTNAHVLPVPGEASFGNVLQIRIPAAGGALESRAASVLAVDPDRDLALLRIDGSPIPVVTLAPPEPVAEGSAVAFMGFPIGGVLGYSTVTHRGIVSAVTNAAIPSPTASRLSSRAASQLRDGTFEVYQLDATAYPGNSGGPLFDIETGQVVGVVNMVLVKGTREDALSHPSGIAYAIPVRFVHLLLQKR